MLKVLDLFSGIGGFSLGLERTGGFRTVAFCEIEPFCQKVLRKHWPDVPIYDDIRELTGEKLRQDGIAADVITGGFPCQDISVAGRQAGIEGERSGLWTELCRLIGDIRPQYAVIENVRNLLSGGSEIVWPSDRCLCGWPYRWRGMLVSPTQQESEHFHAKMRRGHDSEGRSCSKENEEAIRRQDTTNAESNESMGAGDLLDLDGEGMRFFPLSYLSAFGVEVGASEDSTSTERFFAISTKAPQWDGAVVERCKETGGHRKVADIRTEPEGADRDPTGRLVCPSCGRHVANATDGFGVAKWFNRVLGDLAEIGYDAEWHCIPASAVGAPHRRERIWIMAHTKKLYGDGSKLHRKGHNEIAQSVPKFGDGCSTENVANTTSIPTRRLSERKKEKHTWFNVSSKDVAYSPKQRQQRSGKSFQRSGEAEDGKRQANIIKSISVSRQWSVEPYVGRVAHGVPSRVDRLGSLGNAVVPQIPELIGRAILDAEQ